MSKPDWFTFYVHKFLASKCVSRMSAAARGVYILLLCVAWHEEPQGSLPDDDEALAAFGRVKPSEWSKVKESVLRAFEKRADGRLYQPFMEVVAQESSERIENKRRAGKASAKARAEKSNTCSTGVQQTREHTHNTPVVVCVPVPDLGISSDAGGRAGGTVEVSPRIELDPRLEVLMNVGIAFGHAQKLVRDHDTPLDLLTQYVAMASESHVTNRAAYVRAAIAGGYAPRQTGSGGLLSEAAEIAAQEAELRAKRAERAAKSKGAKP